MADSLRSRRSSKDVLRSMLSNLTHLNLTEEVVFDDPVLKGHGGFCDVFQGRWVSKGVCIYKVAIKRLRVHVQTDRDFAKQLAKEIRLWSRLAHRNILPLLGYVIEGDYPSLVSEWMENGTVSLYMREHPETDLLQMILGIARGLEYLHDEGVIHSDIKADNVLVSRSGVPRICDFGISRMIAASQSFGETSTHAGMRGSVRWMSPELLIDGQAEHTMESDIWAFGMTIYELLMKQPPFAHLKRDVQVMLTIMQGATPACPEEFFIWPIYWRKLWSICIVSWNWYPTLRKPMPDVVSYLEFLCRRAAEEKFEFAEEFFDDFRVSKTPGHRKPSILGQEEPENRTETLPSAETSRPYQEFKPSHDPSYGVEYIKESDSTQDEAELLEGSRTHHRRAPSLGKRDIIRDFDLRGRSSGAGQMKGMTQSEREQFELIKKWQESLKVPNSKTESTTSTQIHAKNKSDFLTPKDAEISACWPASRSKASSAGSSTVGMDLETRSASAETDNQEVFREQSVEEITPKPHAPLGVETPNYRTLRR